MQEITDQELLPIIEDSAQVQLIRIGIMKEFHLSTRQKNNRNGDEISLTF